MIRTKLDYSAKVTPSEYNYLSMLQNSHVTLRVKNNEKGISLRGRIYKTDKEVLNQETFEKYLTAKDSNLPVTQQIKRLIEKRYLRAVDIGQGFLEYRPCKDLMTHLEYKIMNRREFDITFEKQNYTVLFIKEPEQSDLSELKKSVANNRLLKFIYFDELKLQIFLHGMYPTNKSVFRLQTPYNETYYFTFSNDKAYIIDLKNDPSILKIKSTLTKDLAVISSADGSTGFIHCERPKLPTIDELQEKTTEVFSELNKHKVRTSGKKNVNYFLRDEQRKAELENARVELDKIFDELLSISASVVKNPVYKGEMSERNPRLYQAWLLQKKINDILTRNTTVRNYRVLDNRMNELMRDDLSRYTKIGF